MRRPLVFCFLAFAASIIMSRYLDGSLAMVLILIALFAVVGIFLKVFKTPLIYWFLIPIFILGFAYCEWREETTPTYNWQENTFYEIEGSIAGFPRQGENSISFPFKTKSIDGEPKEINISLLCDLDEEVKYGDILLIKATPLFGNENVNPGGFDFNRYQADKGITATLSTMYDGSVVLSGGKDTNPILSMGSHIRNKFTAALASLPHEQRDVIAGIFLGDTTGLSQETLDLLSKTGIRHCFCVSGLHVGFIVLFIHLALSAFTTSRRLSLLIMAPFLLLYCGVTGFYPAVCRAAIMCFILYAAMAKGRPGDGFSGLALAGFIILLWNPSTMWLMSFQLSFAAMFSIIYFTPFLERLIPKEFPCKSGILVTIAAQILMLPIIAYYFQMVSLISLVINTLCTFLVGGVMILSLFALILSPFSLVLSGIPLVLAGLIGQLIIDGMGYLASLPLAYYYPGSFPLWLLLFGLALLLIIPQLPTLKFRPIIASIGMMLILITMIFPWQLIHHRQELEMTFLSVGQGDSIYIATPNGKNILVDAANNSSGSTATNRIKPFLLSKRVNTIDYLFITHAEWDHAGSAPYLMEFFHVKNIVFTEASYYYSKDYELLAAASGTKVLKVEAEDSIKVEGLTFNILYPNKEELGEQNDLSMVMQVKYKDFSALLTGDADEAVLKAVMAENPKLKSDILKIPHHGSGTGYVEKFYKKVKPEAAIISVGKNSYGHPALNILNYWVTKNTPLYRTDFDGAITITSKGKAFTITTYKSEKEKTFP